MEADPFDDLLGLEDRFYNEGYELGVADGKKAGKIEGRIFGLENGFEKFAEIGKLHGRSVVWAGRLPQKRSGIMENVTLTKEQVPSDQDDPPITRTLPHLSKNPRLERHIKVVYALVELDTLSTENTDDAVSDFDDRLKRAQGKVKIIEKVIGEESLPDGGSVQQTGGGGNNIEDVDILKARH